MRLVVTIEGGHAGEQLRLVLGHHILDVSIRRRARKRRVVKKDEAQAQQHHQQAWAGSHQRHHIIAEGSGAASC